MIQGFSLCLLFFFFFLTSLLEYSCFTMVCQLLLYNKVNQLYVYIHPNIPSLFSLCLACCSASLDTWLPSYYLQWKIGQLSTRPHSSQWQEAKGGTEPSPSFLNHELKVAYITCTHIPITRIQPYTMPSLKGEGQEMKVFSEAVCAQRKRRCSSIKDRIGEGVIGHNQSLCCTTLKRIFPKSVVSLILFGTLCFPFYCILLHF